MAKLAPAVGLGALTLCGAAHAQGGLPERQFDIGLSVVNSYDTNLLRLQSGEPARPGQSRDDIRATPSLVIDMQMPLGRQSLFLTGSAGYDFYRENKQLERERIELTGGTRLNFRACGSRLAATIGRQQSDLADILTGEPFVNAQTRTSYGVEVSCSGLGPIVPGFSYGRDRLENSDPSRFNGNSTTDSYSVSVNLARPVLGSLGLRVAYSDGRYDRTPDLPPGIINGTRTYSAGLTFDRQLGSQLTGSASASFTRADPRLPGVAGFKGVTYAADLSWNPGTRIQAQLGLSRAVRQPNLLNVSYSIEQSMRATLNYALGERIRLSAGARQSRRSLRDSALTPGPVLDASDRTTAFSGSATFTASRRLTIGVDGRVERQRSDFADLNFNNLSVALTTRLSI